MKSVLKVHRQPSTRMAAEYIAPPPFAPPHRQRRGLIQKIALTLADHYSTSVSTFRNVLSPPTVLPVAPRMPIPASSMVLWLIVFPPGTAKIANVVPVT